MPAGNSPQRRLAMRNISIARQIRIQYWRIKKEIKNKVTNGSPTVELINSAVELNETSPLSNISKV